MCVCVCACIFVEAGISMHQNLVSTTLSFSLAQVALSGWTTKSSDTFSFGVIMSELIGRTPPWLKVDNMFVANPSFPCFPPETPHEYLTLAVRCVVCDHCLCRVLVCVCCQVCVQCGLVSLRGQLCTLSAYFHQFSVLRVHDLAD